MCTRIGGWRSLEENKKACQEKELWDECQQSQPITTIIFKKTYAELSPEFEVKQMVVGKGDINDEVHLLVQKTIKQLE